MILREQQPYIFSKIIGDYRDDYRPIKVRTIRKKIPAGDYSIEGMPFVAVERKTKEDLFQSVGTTDKRDNFIERLHKMQRTLKYGAVVVECNANDLYNDPPSYCKTHPRTVFRTCLSWQQQFTLIHWIFCPDRDWAEQTTYRILEKFFEHETELKYVHHNRPIDTNIEAFRAGIIARRVSSESAAPLLPGQSA